MAAAKLGGEALIGDAHILGGVIALAHFFFGRAQAHIEGFEFLPGDELAVLQRDFSGAPGPVQPGGVKLRRGAEGPAGDHAHVGKGFQHGEGL